MNAFARRVIAIAIVCPVAVSAVSAQAATPRDLLVRAAFVARDKTQALGFIGDALVDTRNTLAVNANDHEARLQQALAIGYRGQINRSLPDAKAARAALESLAAADPRNAETETALAGWHLTAVGDLGGLLARAMLGASKATGLAMLGEAVALGGNRAFFPAYAALIRIRIDPDDRAAALALAQRAAAAAAPTPLDRLLQGAAQKLIAPLKAGDGDGAAKLAKRLLPFGQLR
ncbi:MAG TPA: hypothetical protein VGC10_01625 [Sphingomonas sp.]